MASDNRTYSARDVMDKKLVQARGICAAVAVAIESGGALPEEAAGQALWAARELIEEALMLSARQLAASGT